MLQSRGSIAPGGELATDGEIVYLPHPPTDEEKYSYFQKPRPWIFAWIFISAVGILYGYVMVAIKAPWTTPALLFLPIMLMPVLVNFWLRSHRPRLTLDEHKATIAGYRPDPADTVDIWVPICGEPVAVLDNTCRAVAGVQWHAPVMRYLLDDGEYRAEVEQLAIRYGFVYMRRRDPVPGRPPREGERGWLKKAGNMINAFEFSMGRFGVVFDADFAPRHDFLYETVPYMQAHPRVGIVQTAQYFDIDPWMNYVQRGAGSLQEVFFRWIQPARDVFRAAICAGTNVVYRQDAVASVGGFARVPLGEDVNSGVKLWTGGWETRYLPLALAKGVAPDTWAAITNQQQRWCRSSMLLMTEKHFRDARFDWKQRTAFWAAFLYYMASAGLLITAPFPTITMLWFFPEQVFPHNYLPMVPALLATLLIFPMMARGWKPSIFRLCLINSGCHVIAIWDALQAKVQEWVPTGAVTKKAPKAKKGAPERVSRVLRTWIVGVQVLIWGGLALRFPEYGIGPLWTTALLAAVQLYFVAPLLTPTYGIRTGVPPAEKRVPVPDPFPASTLPAGPHRYQPADSNRAMPWAEREAGRSPGRSTSYPMRQEPRHTAELWQ
ncbi:glycosyltransferase family 2 protein [Solwaraspora sp. WMMD1047]|uniref:glycosyltransferase family 2 protein n=1 Tax=Solwaraspora sp. WMMD1047 TaxID=3016102 RepID=UPI002416F514|nr:glycosyltransferase family 2 protein [Solwaraspora sp. WMMD1047]MDG4829538.1 glycosyltransferase family 2 protein [Solwaraspora sp. WMMD1047]